MDNCLFQLSVGIWLNKSGTVAIKIAGRCRRSDQMNEWVFLFSVPKQRGPFNFGISDSLEETITYCISDTNEERLEWKNKVR